MTFDTLNAFHYSHCSGLEEKSASGLPDPERNTTDWVVYKPQKSTSHSSGGWESEVSVPTWGGQDALLVRRHLVVSSSGGRDKGALWGVFYKGTNLIHEGVYLPDLITF